MVETWGTSWFEEGTRLLYIVPTSFVNSVVPLSIGPAPSKTVRVFVGRMEIVTPATERSVDRALATHDTVTLSKYGRFLEPILQEMLKKDRDAAKLRLLQEALNSVYGAKVARNHLGN
jgi:sulfatase maturation enzyme AslB (radical SAM superfamily)